MPGEGTTAAASTTQSASDVPVREIGDAKIAYEILHYIPEESATHYGLVPIGVAEGVLEVGMLDPEDIEGIDALNFIARTSGMPFKIFKVSKDDFGRVLAMYRGLGGEVEQAVSDLETERVEEKTKSGYENSSLDLEDPSIGKNRGIVWRKYRKTRLR